MFVIKFLISATIVMLTTYIGFSKSKKIKNREYILREFISFLELVKNEINYNMCILPNAYEVSRQKLSTSLKDSIGAIATDMLASQNAQSIDISIVTNINLIEELSDYDKNIIISILRNLGRSDIESQTNIINNGITILENQVKEANEIKLSTSKMYRSMGAIVGLMIVVIFI